jgi:predicted nuclease of predicted toxin-antitoxin system
MRILLDECVNERLRNHLPDHDVQSVRYAGFSGFKNGELLDAAESAGFRCW